MSEVKRIYVGMHDGVCAVFSGDGGKSWERGPVTPLAHAAARLTSSRAKAERAYLAAYEAGVYRTDDGGLTWDHLESYPSGYAHSVLAHPTEGETVYVGSEPATVFRSVDGGTSWEEFAGFRAVPESAEWGFHSPTRDSHVRDLRVAPDDPKCLYAGIEVGGMVGTSDGGTSWRQLPGLNDDIHCVGLSGDRPGRVYVATARAPYRSDDGGGQGSGSCTSTPWVGTPVVLPVDAAHRGGSGRRGPGAGYGVGRREAGESPVLPVDRWWAELDVGGRFGAGGELGRHGGGLRLGRAGTRPGICRNRRGKAVWE